MSLQTGMLTLLKIAPLLPGGRYNRPAIAIFTRVPGPSASQHPSIFSMELRPLSIRTRDFSVHHPSSTVGHTRSSQNAFHQP